MRAYVVNYNPLMLPTHELWGYFDSRSEILNWYLPFAGTIMVVSNHNPTSLANLMSLRFPTHNFLITESNIYNTDGRLANVAWDFIRNPKSSGRWDGIGSGGLAALLGSNNQPKK